MSKSQKSKKNKKSSLSKIILSYFARATWKSKIRTLIMFACIPLDVLFSSILMPFFTAQLIGKLSSGDTNIAHYTTFMLSFAAAMFGHLALTRLLDWTDWHLDAIGGSYLRRLCFDKLSNETIQFHTHHFSGTLTSQANKFVDSYIMLKYIFFWQILPLIITVVFIIGTIWTISPIFSLILIAFLIVFVTCAYIIFLKTHKIEARLPEAENENSGKLADVVTNILNVKSFAREKYEASEYEKSNKRVSKATTDHAKTSFARNLILNVLINLTRLAIIFIIIRYQNALNLTVANIVLVFNLSWDFTRSTWEINSIFRQGSRAYNNALGMAEILSHGTEIVDKSNNELQVKKAEISFRNLKFKHDDQDEQLFEDFSLNIKEGERIGLVGLSGSGKTTLTKLLLRFNEPQGGRITIDGQDINYVTQESLHRNIAYVPQESVLFHRSIADNIAYGKPDATREEIIKAAKLSGADEFIVKLAKGYDTEVGERGATLSGGQRQRVAIARAILKDAPILVLDEATSALDSESEALIQKSLDHLMKNRTSIVIAHRLSTIADLDRIIVLKDGKIVEEGSHRQLLLRDGPYKKLWSRQSGSFLTSNDAESEEN